jgi:hypothetical protein
MKRGSLHIVRNKFSLNLWEAEIGMGHPWSENKINCGFPFRDYKIEIRRRSRSRFTVPQPAASDEQLNSGVAGTDRQGRKGLLN